MVRAFPARVLAQQAQKSRCLHWVSCIGSIDFINQTIQERQAPFGAPVFCWGLYIWLIDTIKLIFYVYSAERVLVHVFLCMLAYYIQLHMSWKLLPLLFVNEGREGA